MTDSSTRISTFRLALVPAVVTLAVTLVRLALELTGAPGWLASNALGGGMALIGITWLPFVFGPYFHLRWREEGLTGTRLLLRVARTLLVYGLLARIPVFVITMAALLGNWGTHYELFPFEGSFAGYFAVTALAQIGFWACVFTPLAGTLSAVTVRALAGPTGHPRAA